MNNRPVETAVLRRQSRPIIINLPIYMLLPMGLKGLNIFSLTPFFTLIVFVVTVRRGRVVNTPTLYSGGPGFKSQPGDRLF
jgi:hypothetical protein